MLLYSVTVGRKKKVVKEITYGGLSEVSMSMKKMVGDIHIKIRIVG
jgi:hypothetical protein